MLTILSEVIMTGEPLIFKGMNSQPATKAKEEVPISPKLSQDTQEPTASSSVLTNSNYMTTRRINSLFSTAFSELRELKNTPMSNREYLTRVEEIFAILKLKTSIILEDII